MSENEIQPLKTACCDAKFGPSTLVAGVLEYHCSRCTEVAMRIYIQGDETHDAGDVYYLGEDGKEKFIRNISDVLEIDL